MKIHTVYSCEICGTEFLCESAARHCETTFLEPCWVKIGDTISLIDRYFDINKNIVDIVVSIRIVRSFSAEMATDYNQEQFTIFLSRLDADERLFHKYLIEVKNYHQIGKEESTNKIDLAWIRKVNGG